MVIVQLKKGREKSVINGNPWIFSGSIENIVGEPEKGELCKVVSYDGTTLGKGYYNRSSKISVRLLNLGKDEFKIENLTKLIKKSIFYRSSILTHDTDSCRLINSEGDFLPGLIVDKFGKGLVIQILTAGMERFREPIISNLIETTSPSFIYERSDSDARKREGIELKEGTIYGTVTEEVLIKENGLLFKTNIKEGQKTGFFFDQRLNRLLLKSYVKDKTVCDCFCYNGGFTVYSLSGNAASVDSIDCSEKALLQLKNNVKLNKLNTERVNTVCDDVFRYLRITDKRYDCIILDPPKFAKNPSEIKKASRGYKDINLLACKNILPGGLIFTFSCSNAIDLKLFKQIVFSAAADSRRRFQVLHHLTAGPDHPVNLAHREGEYLKGLVLRAEE